MKTVYFLKECNSYLSVCTHLISYKTLINYKTAIRIFSQFIKQIDRQDIKLKDMTPMLMKSFQIWLQNPEEHRKPICANTISAYFRSLRSLLHVIQDSQGLERTNPFPQGSTCNFRTAKRAVDEEVIQELVKMDFPEGDQMEWIRDCFLLSYFLCGIPFVDLAKLTAENIQGNYIIYNRSKTGVEIPVQINPCIEYYLRKYGGTESYLFPILTKVPFSQDEYNAKLNFYNRHLKILEDLLHEKSKRFESVHLTSYVARHTWATVANKRNVSLSSISDSMGHTSTSTTLIYIQKNKLLSVSKANETVCKNFYKKFR